MQGFLPWELCPFRLRGNTFFQIHVRPRVISGSLLRYGELSAWDGQLLSVGQGLRPCNWQNIARRQPGMDDCYFRGSFSFSGAWGMFVVSKRPTLSQLLVLIPPHSDRQPFLTLILQGKYRENAPTPLKLLHPPFLTPHRWGSETGDDSLWPYFT